MLKQHKIIRVTKISNFKFKKTGVDFFSSLLLHKIKTNLAKKIPPKENKI